MRQTSPTKKFRKELRLAHRRGKNLGKLEYIIELLKQDISLPQKNKDHDLKGNWAGFRECHIEPDWLLVYKKPDEHTFELVRTGTHSDLFQ